MKLSHVTPPLIGDAGQKLADLLACGCSCGAETARLTRRQNTAKQWSVWLQCETCGKGLGGAQRMAEHTRHTAYPEWDAALADVYWESQNPGFQAREAAFKREQTDYRTKFLQSHEWRTMRLRVLRRAGNLCEACLEAPAQDVHHIRYGLDRMPPAWELRAICRDCHDKLHGASAAWAGR